MTIRLFGLKNCDTCRKALREIQANGQSATFVDLREDDGLAGRLPRWIALAGDRLVNRSSTTWRALSEGDKARAAGTSLESLLLGNPALIKRPVIEIDGEVLLGWTAETMSRIG